MQSGQHPQYVEMEQNIAALNKTEKQTQKSYLELNQLLTKDRSPGLSFCPAYSNRDTVTLCFSESFESLSADRLISGLD